MGLFWNKKKFDICPNADQLKCLVTNFSGGGGVVKINGKLVVPAGYEVVIGRRGKVADKFVEGEHFFSFANLPYCCRKFGIDKIDNGKQKDKFSADVYFVDKGLRAGKFKTYRKVEMGTRAYGIFRAHVFGMYSYKVVNSIEFVQSLLNEFDYIKTGEAEDILESWVDELVVTALEKNNFMIDDVVENKPIIAEKLKQAISKTFDKAGLEICSLEIYKYKLPKKYQKESDDNIARMQAEEQKELEVAEQTELEPTIQVQSEVPKEDTTLKQEASLQTMSAVEENNSKAEDKQKKEYVPFGNFVIKEKEDSLQINSNIQQEKTIARERTFVDLNLDNLYEDNKEKTKRCMRCGEENDIDAKNCSLCGEKFN